MASVDFGGVSREVCLAYVPEAVLGDYCIVHAGFALSLLSEAEARETLTMLREILAPTEVPGAPSRDRPSLEPSNLQGGTGREDA
jgi:hydrogenase expression/formation protein HypC